MVYHKIHDDTDASFMCLGKHPVIIRHCSKLFHDCTIVTDIIAVVVIGRLVDRREPYDIDPQFFQIVQLFRDTVQVADPVSVTVFKTSRIDLIYDAFFPPFFIH